MLDFFIDNIFLVFGERVVQQTIGIPMGTNCAPSLTDLFLHTYDNKRVDFTFPIVNFPFICINITTSQAYRVYISQLIRYSRACAQCSEFFKRVPLLIT